MLSSLAIVVFLLPGLLVLLVCIFAFVKGGAAERIGAVIILTDLILGVIGEHFSRAQIYVLLRDGITAIALLVVALRFASWWLGAVMLLYGLQFALQAYYFVLERPRDNMLVLVNNADFVAVCLCLGVGTMTGWLARSRAQEPPSAALGQPAP